MEEEFSEKPPHILAKELFNGWHFKPLDSQKPQQYYENILVQTGSVLFKHYTDPKDPNFITHSTAQILKILRPKDWSENPNSIMKFPAKFTTKIDHHPYFTYWDYQMAWYNAFLMNNQCMRHSWLIYFKYCTQFKIPNWFQEWWNWYGPSSFEILSEKIQNLWPKFFDKFQPEPDPKHIYRTIHFFSKLCISWIVSWNYSFEQDQYTGILLLIRNYKTKWWDKFNDEKYDSKYLDNFFNMNPRLCESAAPDQTTKKFLQAKSTANTMLVQAKTKKEYKKLMAKMLSSLDSESEDEKCSASSIKMVDLANDTTSVTIIKTKKK
uniref:Uncharacterized protein n=1 Tax=Gossypium raimondii TaxID=29730 RepID=A0A0D2QRV6_GOSRA|nr:hypothetical protein B456_003G115200 [Gossypium raimondii]